MRKVLVLTAALFAFAFAGAQSAMAQQNMVGVKGGFVSATTDIDGFDEDSRSTVGFGGFLQVVIGQSLSIQPEALYLQKGYEAEGGGVTETGKVSYLQVPMLVQFHIPTPGTVSPRLFAGPSIAFELSCDVEGSEGGVTLDASCESFDIDTKSADFGVVFGGGVDIDAGGVVVTLDGRYDLGVTNILDIENEEAKNRAFEFFAGIGFPFGP